MAVLFAPGNMAHLNHKRCRRNATAVMAGAFDPRPPRDVLTSLLNGVGPYKEVEGDEEARIKRKQEKKERKRQERKKQKAERALMQKELEMATRKANSEAIASGSSTILRIPASIGRTQSSSWNGQSRPTILIPSGIQRSVSVTPSPTNSPLHYVDTPGSTPGPSISSSTSRTSSKRPRTPDDDETLSAQQLSASAPPVPKLRKKRVAAKKGWKGWVEGSPEPSDKLINLDAVPLLQERRTRSGKNFDAISIGNQGWV